MHEGKLLGLMKPLGGGDPIPLKKSEMIVGRRPSCDIRLDFENISGRHCVLSFINGTWHVRDLGSTNGTKVNGQKLNRVQGILPDDELAIASHLFHIEYEPAAPLMDSHQFLEEEEAIRDAEARRPTSLMELAGFKDVGRGRASQLAPGEDSLTTFEVVDDGPSRASRSSRPAPPPRPSPSPRSTDLPEPEPIDLSEPDEPAPRPEPPEEDDFFKLIEDEVRHDRP